MIFRVIGEQIVKNWDKIKFAAVTVNNFTSEKRMQQYCNGLLANLLNDKVQCWFNVDDERKKVRALALTRIYKDVGDQSHLLIDVVYGFAPTAEEDKKNFLETMVAFGSQIGCENVFTWTGNQMAMNAAEKAGFTRTHMIYSIKIGGGE